ncbi:MAG TPA: phage portal protein [Vicinamibacterales bacterium]|nr:phage portal protein [Vicinamibacterales bacterium]
MKIFGDISPTPDSVTKKIPAGGVAARDLSADADRLSRRGAFADQGAPAAGARPHPGPIPASGETGPAENLRHAPIRWNYPYAYNQVWTPRSKALTPFAVLRQLAEVDDIIRICIETRKDQMTSLDWDIVPRDKKQGSGLTAKIQLAREFFARPDRRRDFSTWLRMAIEDVLVVDALSIYRRRTRGGRLYALELKDGTTFLPLLDEDGDLPLPPKIAYRQIINGVPMEGGDCTVDELMYRPRTVRTHTPYGLSPTEAVLLTVNAALSRQVFNLQYYTEGNVPEGLLEVPSSFTTTQQMADFQEYLDDYLAGLDNLGRRRRLKVVGSGSKVHEFKEPDFTSVYDEWLLKVRCAAFAVPPQEVGFTADVNKATGEQQENVAYRRGVKPLGRFFKGIFDEALVAMDAAELEWVWTGGEVEDKLKQAQADRIYVSMGKTSVDELRSRDGQEPIGLGPYIETAMGPIFVDELLTGRDPDADLTTTDGGRTPAGETLDGDAKTTPSGKGAAQALAEAQEDGAEKLSDAALADLRKWRACAIKAVKAGRAVPEFVSDTIPLELHVRVERFVKLAAASGDVGKVVVAFDLAIADHQVTKAGESRTMTRLEQRAAKAYQRLMKRHFRAQGRALAEHLKQGLGS